jgi:mercuric ion transport protein
MRDRILLKIGLIGTIIAALCCFTPLLAVLFGAAGLAAWAGGADLVVVPLLALFVLLTGYSLWKLRRQTSN